MSDYRQPYGEFTSLAWLTLALGAGLPLCVAAGTLAVLRKGSDLKGLSRGAALGAGIVMGSGIFSGTLMYVANLYNPLTFSYSYQTPSAAAEFAVYCLVMVVGSAVAIAVAPTLLAHQIVGRLSRGCRT